MDWRALFLLIAVLAFGAGVLVGWGDFRREKLAREAPGKLEGASPAPEPRGPLVRRSTPARFRGGGDGYDPPLEEPAFEAGGEPAAGTPDRPSRGHEEPDVIADAARSSSGTPLGPAQAEQISRLEKLLADHEFATAAGEARQLAASSSGVTRELALRLEAKARAFEKLIPAPAPQEGKVFEVLLSNQQKVRATKLQEEPDSYRLTLENGSIFSPRREDVLRIQQLRDQAVGREQWEALAPRIARLEHPVDLYFRGVVRCYQLGLRQEGYRLLERLLLLPDSELVPILHSSDDEEVLKNWELARSPLPVAGAGPARPNVPAPRPRPELFGPDENKALARANQLFGEAKALFGAAFGKEGREDEIQKAYDKLLEAQQILGRLPPSDQVRDLSRAVSHKLFDVAKALPF
jgi:hypothetical protein